MRLATDIPVTNPLSLRLSDVVFCLAVLCVMYADFLRHFLPDALGGALQHGIVFAGFAAALFFRLIRGRLSAVDLWLVFLSAGLIAISLLGGSSRGLGVAVLSTALLVKLGYIASVSSAMSTDRLAMLFPVLAALQVLGLFLNLGLPDFFAGLAPQVYEWLDRSDIAGLQLNVNRYGVLSALLFVWYIFLRPRPAIALVMLVGVILSGSRSGLILLVLFSAYFAVRGTSRRLAFWAVLVTLIVFPTLLLMSDWIDAGITLLRQSVTLETLYIRTIMLVHGARLAMENFPFGAGGGVFGSPLSIGSHIYDQIGIARLPTIEEGHGINDSGIGSLLGEYGVAGLLLILISVAGLLQGCARGYLSRADIVFLLLVFVVGSLFRAMISSYYYAIVLILLTVMLCLHRRKHQTSQASV